jgi:hypothetical protein
MNYLEEQDSNNLELVEEECLEQVNLPSFEVITATLKANGPIYEDEDTTFNTCNEVPERKYLCSNDYEIPTVRTRSFSRSKSRFADAETIVYEKLIVQPTEDFMVYTKFSGVLLSDLF